MSKRTKIVIGTALCILALFTSPSFTQTYSRNITAWFNQIVVKLDGEEIPLKNEVFIYNDRVYLPIEELADRLYMNVSYDQDRGILSLQSNRLNVTNPDASVVPVAFQKNYQLENLQNRIAELETELSLLKGSSIPYKKITTVAEMESYLNSNFKKLKDLTMKIKLTSLGNHQYKLEAYYTSDDSNKWSSLDRRDIEGWIDDAFFAIRELFDEAAVIKGDIYRSSFKGASYASYWTRGNTLYFDFRLAEHKENVNLDGKKIEQALNQRIGTYRNAKFTYSVYVNGNDVDVVATYQKAVDGWSPQVKAQFLKRLKQEVERVYKNVNIYGQLIESGKNSPLLRFNFDGSNIVSTDLMDEVEKYLNKHYSLFEVGRRSFKFEYTLGDGIDTGLRITLQGDFRDTDSDWRDIETTYVSRFRSFLLDACRYVESIWDADIYGDVLDNRGEVITHIEFYSPDDRSTRTLQPLTF